MKFKINKKFYIRETCLFTDEINLVEVSFWGKLKDIYDNIIYYPIFCRLKYWYYDNVCNLTRRIKTILSYIPLLWYDFDFDHSYLLKLIKHKLERMIPVFENGHTDSCKDNAKEMRICVNLINRLLEDKYSDELFEKLDKRFGTRKDRCERVKNEDGSITYIPIKDKNREEEYSKYFRIWRKEAESKLNADKELLFHIMKRKINCWWD